MAHTVSDSTIHQFAKLADLLDQASRISQEASRVARAIAQGNVEQLSIPIPDLTPPAPIPKDEAWFWSEDWLAGEREVNEDIKAARISKAFDTPEELLADLHRIV